jgi:hypothetical protein
MNITQVVVELHKIQERIDKLVNRSKELNAERDLYREKFETGEISITLYNMRMTTIFFEKGMIKVEYKEQVKLFDNMETEYVLLKCFESEEENLVGN